MTIRIPSDPRVPVPPLMDVNVEPLIDVAATVLRDEMSVMVDSGIAPSGDAIPNRSAATVYRRRRAGSTTPGHRTGATKQRWRTRKVKRGKRAGNTIVELAPLEADLNYSANSAPTKFRNQLSAILGGANYTPGTELMDTVNAAVTEATLQCLEFPGSDGRLAPAKRGK